jgi:hypothetical protein
MPTQQHRAHPLLPARPPTCTRAPSSHAPALPPPFSTPASPFSSSSLTLLLLFSFPCRSLPLPSPPLPLLSCPARALLLPLRFLVSRFYPPTPLPVLPCLARACASRARSCARLSGWRPSCRKRTTARPTCSGAGGRAHACMQAPARRCARACMHTCTGAPRGQVPAHTKPSTHAWVLGAAYARVSRLQEAHDRAADVLKRR